MFALTSLFGLSGLVLAQGDQAHIVGVVHDQNNAIVVGATVTVKNERTGEVRAATGEIP